MSYVSTATIIGDVAKIQIVSPGQHVRLLVDTYEEYKKYDEIKKLKHTHSITVFNSNLALVVEKYIKQGDKVYVDGILSYRKKDDKLYTNITVNNFNGSLTKLSSGSTETELYRNY